MLERLFASMVNGPAMNCRPHASRQRVDLWQLNRLKDIGPGEVMTHLLGPDRAAMLLARVPAVRVPVAPAKDEGADEPLPPAEREARQAWADQQSLLAKLRVIADEARTYEQDTGVHALNVGFPLLSLPPGAFGARSGGAASRRVLAPVAFIPITLIVKAGAKPGVEIACRGEGVDLVVPNAALLAWLEQQTGHALAAPFNDEAGEQPWREIAEMVKLVAAGIDVPIPPALPSGEPPPELALLQTPRGEEEEKGTALLNCAVLGLFPTSNQALLKDTREMIDAGAPDGPISSFLQHGVSLDIKAESAADPVEPAPIPETLNRRNFSEERLVAQADPCQGLAVRLARQCRGLVIHGPPGTGKSQTIANVIADHLARGERVLFVCDKRTALDVVADRLRALGLGDLLATVHDPRRDQRDLYRSVREQLDNLAQALPPAAAVRTVAAADAELRGLYDQLSDYYRRLMGEHRGGPGSFHDQAGRWLAESTNSAGTVAHCSFDDLSADEFESHAQSLRELLTRGESVTYRTNPWKDTAAVELSAFLSTPMDVYRSALARCLAAAEKADALMDPLLPPFEPTDDLAAEAQHRRQVGIELRTTLILPAEARSRAARLGPPEVVAARTELSNLQSSIDLIHSRPLDAELSAACDTGFQRLQPVPLKEQAAPHPNPRLIEPEPQSPRPAQRERGIEEPSQLSEMRHCRETLTKYADAFDRLSSRFVVVRQAAPDAPEPLILKWMAADSKVTAAASRRLASAAPLADAVAAAPLDAALLSRWESSALPARIIPWLAAVQAYLDVAGTWHAFLHIPTRKAAAPALQHFGLSLSPESAVRVKQFLEGVQTRSDLAAAVRAAAGENQEPLDDLQLVERFQHNHAVLLALDAAIPPNLPHDDIPTAALNALLGAEAETAAAVLAPYQLQPDAVAARRVAARLEGLEARLRVRAFLLAFAAANPAEPDPPDAELVSLAEACGRLLVLLSDLPGGRPLGDAVRAALAEPTRAEAACAALEHAPQRAAAVLEIGASLAAASLFSAPALATFDARLRAGEALAETIAELSHRLDSLESVLRVRDGLKSLPPALANGAGAVLSALCNADEGFSAISHKVLAADLARRIRQSPPLQAIDGHRLRTAFDRFRGLGASKKVGVRDLILSHWLERQRQRLLATTMSRLNAAGADLRRRLTTRGERAMRLRQVLAHGAGAEGGDPLFDLRPVWMASPETAAQLFGREPLFEVVVFDEASQCRLEEALPVLTRAKRVVIAGDPKQLPPTRFFESAVAASTDDDPDSDAELFEAHQGEVEDLLTAALGLDVQQCYLDVHYRSRNADLIGFSNEHFYGSRLQAIPGHPSRRARYAPLTLYSVNGVYEKRRNPAEADAVCRIVHDLLKRAAPPSIGIACFNLVQRDLIVEKLDELAEDDAEFGRRLAVARQRRGAEASEALFVKNLENVQGDERDHIIISTTYGPDAAGRFRRNFGPLGAAGGARRLNVLVTRARNELHVVTSIPRSAYGALQEIPPGTSPSGAWLLFAFLQHVERLAETYRASRDAEDQFTGAAGAERVTSRPTRSPSRFAEALACRLAEEHRQGSELFWGNDGFGVDLALRHPARPDEVTLGVLCDMTRFAGSDDPVEWDVFRTAIHESQGWQLRRVWTPHFFRDAAGTMSGLVEAAREAARKPPATA